MNPKIPPAPDSATFAASVEPAATSSRNWRSLVVNTLVVVCLLGFFAAIIIPTTSRSPIPARRSIDSSNLRQIGQASLIYASDSQDRLPQVDNIHAFAAELARLGGLNDATIWFSTEEYRGHDGLRVSTVLTPDRQRIEPSFAAARPSFAAAVRGLHAALPSTTPIAWTRGLQPDGTWSEDSPYGGEGGHIVFLGGNVSFYRKLGGSTPALVDREGRPTADIRAALPADAVIANN